MCRLSQVLRETDAESQASLPDQSMRCNRPKPASHIVDKSSEQRKRNQATARVVKPHGILSITTHHHICTV